MKKYLAIIILGLLAACSTDEAPVQPQPEEQPQVLEAPQLSRSITATDAAIAAFRKDGSRAQLWKLEKNGDDWQWASGTQATLSGWDTLVCVVPYVSNLTTATSYTPSQNSTLQWGKLGKGEQHEDGRFYFKSISHRLAQVFVEVDRYYSGDELRMYLATRGDFNALSGGFADLNDSYKSFRPEKTDSGTYVYTFSIVPQTFAKGENLLRYRDEHTSYYDYYYYKPEEDLVVPANHRLNIRLKWKQDWEQGGRHYYDVEVSVTGVSLDKTELDLNEGETFTLTATVSPSNATNKSVTWSSSNTAAATVDSNGKVTAVKAGEATITAKTANGQTATCTVIVRGEVKGEVENTPTGGGGSTGNIDW